MANADFNSVTAFLFLRSGRRGRGFESRHLDQKSNLANNGKIRSLQGFLFLQSDFKVANLSNVKQI